MQKKKIIRNMLAFILVFVLGVLALAPGSSVVHAEGDETATIQEKSTESDPDPDASEVYDLDSDDPLGLGADIMQFVGNGRKDIPDYKPQINAGKTMFRTAQGQVVNVTPGESIHYGNWSTNKFSIDGKYLGYCAQPNSPTPRGNYAAYELNNDMVKVCLMCAPGGPLDGKIGGFPAGSIFYDPNVPGGNMYANAHAAIGYVYSGSLAGLSSSYAAGIKSFVQRAASVKNNGTGAYDSAAKWDAWKVMIAPNNNQDIVWLESVPRKGTVRLTKTSANAEITNGIDCYSLEGAFYGIWKNKECTSGTGLSFTTDKNGVANLNGTLDAGTYFVKEITAPKGYALDKTVYTVQVKPNETAQLNVKDIPQSDPVSILLGKVDKETNSNKPQGSASLEGAEFTIKYFEGLYDTNPESQGIRVTRQWVLRTREDGKAILSDKYIVSGDELYKMDGVPTLPIGTITIQETKAPEGYLLNAEVFIRKITSDGNAEKVETYNQPIIPEQSLNLNIVKKLKGTDIVIPGAKFKHILPDGTTEVVTTDEKGQASVKALTWGLHTIEEVSVPDGYTKNPGKVTFTVAEDNTITVKSNTAKDGTGKMSFTVKEDGSASLVVEDTYAPYRLLLKKNNEKGKALQGAEFTLYSDKACTKEVTKGTTKEDGTLEFAKLEVETKYYLKETKAPEGYRIPVNPDGSDVVTEIYTKSNPLKDAFESYVNGTKHTEKDGAYAITGTTADRVVNLTVVNNTGNRLPETGTPWRLLLVDAGLCCMIGALVYSVKKGKKEGKENEKDKKN